MQYAYCDYGFAYCIICTVHTVALNFGETLDLISSVGKLFMEAIVEVSFATIIF